MDFLQVYCAMLALVTAILPRLRLLKTHLSVLLLAAFFLAAYRNLLPLALGRKPLDIVLHHLKGIHDPLWDTLVWLRVGLLGLAGVILPLILLLRCTSLIGPACCLSSRQLTSSPPSFAQLPRTGTRSATARSPSSGTGKIALLSPRSRLISGLKKSCLRSSLACDGCCPVAPAVVQSERRITAALKTSDPAATVRRPRLSRAPASRTSRHRRRRAARRIATVW